MAERAIATTIAGSLPKPGWLAETERPAAVYLAVPEHIDADEDDYPDLSPLPRNVVRADAPAARQIARAVDILRAAVRPVPMPHVPAPAQVVPAATRPGADFERGLLSGLVR